jgi:predicted aspartyl protease
MRQFATIVALGAIILGIITPTARADDCKLQAIPVDLVPNPAGQMLVALKINQQPSLFVLDTGAGVSVIHRGKTTGMPIYTSARGVSGVSGVVSKDYVVVPTLSIGSVKFHNVQMFVEPDDPDPGNPVFGVLGANILAMLDIEINMSENKLNFFLPSGCGDRVVYGGEKLGHWSVVFVAMRAE